MTPPKESRWNQRKQQTFIAGCLKSLVETLNSFNVCYVLVRLKQNMVERGLPSRGLMSPLPLQSNSTLGTDSWRKQIKSQKDKKKKKNELFG